jgi:hypothetical protein
MNFRTRLPELRFEINEATVISVLTEWVRSTYELSEREYSLEFVKSAIDNQYHVTASFIDPVVRRPTSFEEIAEEARHDSNFQRPQPFSPFTIRTPPSADTNTDTNVAEEPGGSDNGVPAPKV